MNGSGKCTIKQGYQKLKKNIYNFSLKYGTYPLMCVMCI